MKLLFDVLRGISGRGRHFIAAALAIPLLLLSGAQAYAQGGSVTIKGTVKDASTGEVLAGVAVIEKGLSNGVATDLDGQYTIKVKSDATLEFSFIGFATQSIKVGVQGIIDVALVPDAEYLDETVVIGYGTAKKSDLTGAISSVRAEKVETEAPRSIQDILRSNIAGLQVSMSTNAAGTADLQVRGKNTLTAGSSPLIVLDGVIFDGSLADINPMDIESVDVLKDASSVAVYGAKAASGVVAIITKKGGKEGKPTVNFNANVGMVQAANRLGLLDGEGFIKMRQSYSEGLLTEAEFQTKKGMYTDPRELSAIGVDPLTWYNYDQKTPATTLPDQTTLVNTWLSRLCFSNIEMENYHNGITTDWEDEYFQRGLQQDYTASVSNRTDRSSYYWSVGYADREGQLTNDRYKSIRSRINLETKVTDFLTIGANVSFTTKDESALKVNTDQYTHSSPYTTNEIDNLESPYRAFTTGDNNCVNPFYHAYYTDRMDISYTLNTNMFATVKLPFGFEYQANFTPYFKWRKYYNHNSSEDYSYAGTNGKSERTNQETYNWQIDNVLRWKKQFGEHRFEFTGLQNAEKGQYWSNTIIGKDYSPSDILGYHRVNAAETYEVSSDDTYRTGDALMARLFYSFKNTYMITASVRRDGYSAFGINNPRATFPAVALAWTFSNEKFLKGAQWLNYGKLRFSWGVNGNRDIGQYKALSNMTASKHAFINQQGSPYVTTQIYVSSMANKDLKWERTEAFNIGLDFAMFNNRINGSIEAYNSQTHDLLVSRSLPKITGYTNVTANLGKLANNGLEVTLNGDIVKGRDFTWNSGVAFSLNRRKILSLYGDMTDVLDENGNVIGQKEVDDPSNNWFIGHDPDQIWEYVRDGVWQADEAAEAKKYGCLPGDLKYVDQNGDGVMNNDDKVFQGYTTPRFFVSWRNEWRWKNWSATMMIYSRLGQYRTYNRAANAASMLDRYTYYDVPYWTWDNPSDTYGRLGSKNIATNYLRSNFVRIDNISVAYNVPKALLQKISIQGLRVALSVRNPFLITAYPVGDPEGGDYTMQSFNLNLNITL